MCKKNNTLLALNALYKYKNCKIKIKIKINIHWMCEERLSKEKAQKTSSDMSIYSKDITSIYSFPFKIHVQFLQYVLFI